MILTGKRGTEIKSPNPSDNWSNHRVIAKCECDHPWHYIEFCWFTGGMEDDPELYVEVGLVKRSFWKRLIYGIKYIFGYTNGYFGCYDTVALDISDVRKLVPELQSALELMETEEKRFVDKILANKNAPG